MLSVLNSGSQSYCKSSPESLYDAPCYYRVCHCPECRYSVCCGPNIEQKILKNYLSIKKVFLGTIFAPPSKLSPRKSVVGLFSEILFGAFLEMSVMLIFWCGGLSPHRPSPREVYPHRCSPHCTSIFAFTACFFPRKVLRACLNVCSPHCISLLISSPHSFIKGSRALYIP